MTGPPTGGTPLTIEGRGFLILEHPPTVWVGSERAVDVEVRSNTVISCTVPPGLGRNLTVKVTPSARMYPAKAGVVGASTTAPSEAVPPSYLRIAGETAILQTGFSYGGKHSKRDSKIRLAFSAEVADQLTEVYWR